MLLRRSMEIPVWKKLRRSFNRCPCRPRRSLQDTENIVIWLPLTRRRLYRQLLRFQSIRQWWSLRGRAHNSGGVDCRLLKLWTNAKFPASPTNIVDGIPLAGPEWNVVVDPVKERALWDTWGRQAWLTIVATEKDWVEDKGYLWGMAPVHFAMDRSLFKLPSSPFINLAP